MGVILCFEEKDRVGIEARGITIIELAIIFNHWWISLFSLLFYAYIKDPNGLSSQEAAVAEGSEEH